MATAVIVDAVRTAGGKRNGKLSGCCIAMLPPPQHTKFMKFADGNEFAGVKRLTDDFRLCLDPCLGLFSGVDANVLQILYEPVANN